MKLITLSCVALLVSSATADVMWTWTNKASKVASPVSGTCYSEILPWGINRVIIRSPIKYCILHTGPNCDGQQVQLNAGYWRLRRGQANSYACYY